ncbi:MAG TPA: EamA family transporter [Nitrolancea sp.]|nr:EamA family transporter [Nitrolancea sp.]
MQSVAVGLVVLSALFHSIWNLLAKRSGDPLAFMFSFHLVSIVVYFVPAMIALQRHPIPRDGWPFLLFSTVCEILYYVSLAEAYRNGALALTYPVARGTGLLLVAILAAPIYGEIPSVAGGLGIAAIFLALVVLAIDSLRAQRVTVELSNRRGLLFAVAAGFGIASYSLIDKAGVDRVFPLVYVYLIFVTAAIGLAPYVLTRRRAAFIGEWRFNRRSILLGGLLPMGVYFIVLSALRLGNVSYVVPLREISIFFGMLLGVLVLHERLRSRQIAAASMIILGVLAIALGG